MELLKDWIRPAERHVTPSAIKTRTEEIRKLVVDEGAVVALEIEGEAEILLVSRSLLLRIAGIEEALTSYVLGFAHGELQSRETLAGLLVAHQSCDAVDSQRSALETFLEAAQVRARRADMIARDPILTSYVSTAAMEEAPTRSAPPVGLELSRGRQPRESRE